jgi:predicted NodU family carbamoyl transferase
VCGSQNEAKLISYFKAPREIGENAMVRMCAFVSVEVKDWFREMMMVRFIMQVSSMQVSSLPEKHPLIPAVSPFDGSGRLQAIHRHTNPRYST